ncbi:unnamed protein product [Nezara viridula]|uniref:Uncharacterized protein n=1 Tax=Nezara viridula TaxID=85310 RepID=A0A9P0H3I7_NEZVI|nr:unnamed protein product [Nezara viridula]
MKPVPRILLSCPLFIIIFKLEKLTNVTRYRIPKFLGPLKFKNYPLVTMPNRGCYKRKTIDEPKPKDEKPAEKEHDKEVKKSKGKTNSQQKRRDKSQKPAVTTPLPLQVNKTSEPPLPRHLATKQTP